MSDEIKEAILYLEHTSKDDFNLEEHQKENTILKENAEHNDKVVDKARWNEMIYKSRCEKATEYIQNHQLVFRQSNKKQIEEWFNEFYKDMSSILGGDK